MIQGQRLRELREARGLSSADLANELGISKSQILRYETGRGDATAEVLVKFARYFKVSADYLVGLADVSDPVDPNGRIRYEFNQASEDQLLILKLLESGTLDEISIAIGEYLKKNIQQTFK